MRMASGKKNSISFTHKILFSIINVCLVLFLVLLVIEISSRLFSSDDRYYVHEPNSVTVFNTSKGVMPGIDGETRFTVNSYGLRWPESCKVDDEWDRFAVYRRQTRRHRPDCK